MSLTSKEASVNQEKRVSVSTNISNRFYFLDAARGIAAISIVVFHFFSANIKILSGLYIFVDFFFVLSGFVLAKSYTSKLSRVELKQYVRSRFLRLFPMPLCTILLIVLYQLALNIKHISNPANFNETINIKPLTILLGILMLQNFSQSAMLLNFPLWSLSAEWFTNLIMLVVPIQRKPRLLTLIIYIGIAMVMFYEFSIWGQSNFNWVSNTGRALSGFSIGILVRKNLELKREIKGSIHLISLLSIAVVIVYYLILVYVDSQYIFAAPIPFACLVYAVAKLELFSSAKSWFRSLCSFLGKISFGVYVWHIPVHNTFTPMIAKVASAFNVSWPRLSLIDFLLTLLISIWISVIFYRHIDPKLKLRFGLPNQ